jgi:hypothetical protein
VPALRITTMQAKERQMHRSGGKEEWVPLSGSCSCSACSRCPRPAGSCSRAAWRSTPLARAASRPAHAQRRALLAPCSRTAPRLPHTCSRTAPSAAPLLAWLAPPLELGLAFTCSVECSKLRKKGWIFVKQGHFRLFIDSIQILLFF